MVNTRQKGNRIERKAEDRLQNNGYRTARMPHTRYGDSDFYNLYDIIAVKPDAPLKMVQVKTNQFSKLEKYLQQSLETTPEKHCIIEYWVWHDYKGWEIRRLNREKKKWEKILDQR